MAVLLDNIFFLSQNVIINTSKLLSLPWIYLQPIHKYIHIFKDIQFFFANPLFGWIDLHTILWFHHWNHNCNWSYVLYVFLCLEPESGEEVRAARPVGVQLLEGVAHRLHPIKVAIRQLDVGSFYLFMRIFKRALFL